MFLNRYFEYELRPNIFLRFDIDLAIKLLKNHFGNSKPQAHAPTINFFGLSDASEE
jgi:hypothetical protein